MNLNYVPGRPPVNSAGSRGRDSVCVCLCQSLAHSAPQEKGAGGAGDNLLPGRPTEKEERGGSLSNTHFKRLYFTAVITQQPQMLPNEPSLLT